MPTGPNAISPGNPSRWSFAFQYKLCTRLNSPQRLRRQFPRFAGGQCPGLSLARGTQRHQGPLGGHLKALAALARLSMCKAKAFTTKTG